MPLIAALGLAACSTFPAWLPSAGPSAEQVEQSPQTETTYGIRLVDITDDVTRRLLASQRRSLFSEVWGQGGKPHFMIGPGDVLEVTVWEAPPAALFGGAGLAIRGVNSTSQAISFPEQVVNSSGQINIPFAGQVQADGRTPQDIEADITQRLKGKAHQPQVMVRVSRNATSNVTVVGEVVNSTRLALTAKGERLLDVLAAAGGVRQPVAKMTVQITRGNRVLALPLDMVITDPLQNIVLQPGDVITALHQPFSLTVLGATGRNEELNFETQGLTLAQTLARAGGLQDNRADARGVFVFRFEDPAALPPDGVERRMTPEGKVAVVYRVNLRDPAAFFVAQGFPMRHRDVVYVANAPAAELQKFLNLISSVVAPAAAVRAVTN